MTPDEYVLSVLARYRVATGPSSVAEQTGQALYPLVAARAGGLSPGGAILRLLREGHRIRGGNDVDIFISVAPDTPATLKGFIGTW